MVDFIYSVRFNIDIKLLLSLLVTLLCSHHTQIVSVNAFQTHLFPRRFYQSQSSTTTTTTTNTNNKYANFKTTTLFSSSSYTSYVSVPVYDKKSKRYLTLFNTKSIHDYIFV